MNWLTAHPLRLAWTAIAGILVLGAFAPLLEPPRAVRDWYPYLGHDVDVTIEPEAFSLSPLSAWTYAPSGPVHEHYIAAAHYRFEDLRGVWFVLEPQPGSQLAAHTLLLFEFSDDRLLGVTIEARRERHEDYSALSGVFNAYELAYVWGTARDFLTRRVVMLQHEVFVYPVALTPPQQRTLLHNLLRRTEALETAPRYYNTLFSNCTNELAKAAGLDWTPEFVLTGRSDEYLFARELIPGSHFDEAQARADMSAFVAAANIAPETFDRVVLAELRRRNALTVRE